MQFSSIYFCAMCSVLLLPAGAAAQQRPAPSQPPPSSAAMAAREEGTAATAALPTGYVIGASDVLSVVFWRDKDMSADVTVRPDGNISLPLLNDVAAAGYTPDQLRTKLVEAASKYIEDPNATVVVKEIHSRNVYVTGNVAKPATYALMGDMTVLQLIALAGGLQEYADAKNIVVIRNENGRPMYHKFNYKDVVKQKHVEQNIVLKPGDTVVVP
jgi:polysaccharide biosynthesis/export protein